MRVIDNVFLALKRLRSRFFESLLMIVAIGLGTGVICSALALTLVFMDLQTAATRDMSYMYRQITISSGDDYVYSTDSIGVKRLGDHIPEPAKLTIDVLGEIKESCPDVAYVFSERGGTIQFREHDDSFWERFRGVMTPEDYQKMEEERQKYYLNVTLTTPDYFGYKEVKLARGSFFSDRDVEEANPVIVLGARAAERLFPGEDAIGKQVSSPMGTQPLTVIGVLELLDEDEESAMSWENSRTNSSGFAPLTVNIWGGPIEPEIYYITAIATSTDTVLQAERQINNYMRSRFVEGYTVRSYFADLMQIQPAMTRGQIIAVLAASLGLLIAAINILNLMLARMLRRTKEIGVLVALGSTRRGIFSSFLWEALLLGVFGAILGFVLSFAGKGILVSLLGSIPIKIDYRVFVSAVGISGIVSLLFGVYPAVEASRINPVDALRTD